MNFSVTPEKINPEQRAAIIAVDGPSLVIAGPGSGKTRTLTVKARYIRRLYPDARILCVTHTRKAADEMRARIGRQRTLAQFTYPRSTPFAIGFSSQVSDNRSESFPIMTMGSSYGWRHKRPASTATTEKLPPLSARPNSD